MAQCGMIPLLRQAGDLLILLIARYMADGLTLCFAAMRYIWPPNSFSRQSRNARSIAPLILAAIWFASCHALMHDVNMHTLLEITTLADALAYGDEWREGYYRLECDSERLLLEFREQLLLDQFALDAVNAEAAEASLQERSERASI
jgi:hypothetical protein